MYLCISFIKNVCAILSRMFGLFLKTMDNSEITNDDVFISNVSKDIQVHNREMNLAWQFVVNTNVSVFLTGKAGTGKTTFLKKLRELAPKRMVVLAPTGVAAINANGQTIHSFFQLPFSPNIPEGIGRKSYFKISKEKKNLIKTLDLLVIDEVSMVRCDLLDAVDQELRKYRDRTKPFGGVQLLLIGDLLQLAPVTKEGEWELLSPYYSTPYFFASKALSQINYITIELKQIYRQQDAEFIDLLAKIRDNKIDNKIIQDLNTRYIANFEPSKDEDWIRLTTHNKTAQSYNEYQLTTLKSEPMHFQAKIKGNFPESAYPADYDLILKKGSQVMFIKNDPSTDKAYYNGKIGIIESIEWKDVEERQVIYVFCKEDQTSVMVRQVIWENTRYVIDEKTKEIKEEVEGTFVQYPLRLAWSITVHKSQGLTFDHAVLDINRSFTHGQVYVALSRCRTLEGLVLSSPLQSRSVITDISVDEYINRKLIEGCVMERQLPQIRHKYYSELLDEAFSFDRLKEDFKYVIRVVDEQLYKSYPELLQQMNDTMLRLDKDVIEISRKFRQQYNNLLIHASKPANDKKLQERLQVAFNYFNSKLAELFGPLSPNFAISIDNKQISNLYNNALETFYLRLKVKLGTIKRLTATDEPFTVKNYLMAKAHAALDDLTIKPTKSSANNSKSKKDKLAEEIIGIKPKIDTKHETLKLYRDGLKLVEIAKTRGLSVSTIEHHLAQLVALGEIDIDEVVSPQHRKLIEGVIRSFTKSYTSTDIKSILPPEYSYAEIKCVVEKMKK